MNANIVADVAAHFMSAFPDGLQKSYRSRLACDCNCSSVDAIFYRLFAYFRDIFMLDRIDLAIAAELQKNNTLSSQEIAARIGLSPSSVHRRIVRLRKDKVVLADVSILDPKALGYRMTFIVEIILEKVRTSEVAAIKKRLQSAPEVQQIYNVTGDVDLLLIVVACDMEHFEHISRQYFSADPHVRRYRTSVVMDRVKCSLALPLGSDAAATARKRPKASRPV